MWQLIAGMLIPKKTAKAKVKSYAKAKVKAKAKQLLTPKKTKKK